MNSRRLWIPAGITLALVLVGGTVDATALARSWLAAALTWGALPLGALPVLMTHGLTGGRWGEQSLFLWRALAGTVILLVISLVPLLFAMELLFPWTQPEAQLPEVVRNKLAYLNIPFFWLRTLGYCLIWLGLAWLLGAWNDRSRRIQAPGLLLWLMAVTFFGFDWLQSLEPRFYSDIFGLMIATQMIAAAFALVLLLGRFEAGVHRDLVHLWVAVLLGWAFVSYSQFIIIWSGNLPDEIGWYLHRSSGPWRAVGWAAFLLFFALPFVLIITTLAGCHRFWLRVSTLSCLAGHLLYMHWLLLPAFGEWQPAQYWLTPTLVAGLAATYAGLASRGAGIRPRDRQTQGSAHENSTHS